MHLICLCTMARGVRDGTLTLCIVNRVNPTVSLLLILLVCCSVVVFSFLKCTLFRRSYKADYLEITTVVVFVCLFFLIL